MKTVFIYALCEPGTRHIRYIGKANNPKRRLQGHLSKSARYRTHLGCWLRSLTAGQIPNLVILSEIDANQWEAEEVRYIQAAKALGIRLVNATSGGEGGLDRKHSPEARLKMSKARRGVKHSAAHRANMSAAQLGRKLSQEARDKIRVAKLGNKYCLGKSPSVASRMKNSTAHLGSRNSRFGKRQSQDTRDKIAESVRSSWTLRKKAVKIS